MYERYAKLRDSKGITDYKVASDTGIPPTVFYEWKRSGEYGYKKCNPKADKLMKLAEYFDVPLEYFYKED